MKAFKRGFLKLKEQDLFGTPIAVNYKGKDSYKSIFGGAITVIIFAFVLAQFIGSAVRIADRENAEYASHFQSKFRGRADALNVPGLKGQMYIGLKQREENPDGSFNETFISLDETYINSKINFYTNGILQGRINMTACDDRADFEAKIRYSNGLASDDFGKMKCIPKDTFFLYNQAE